MDAFTTIVQSFIRRKLAQAVLVDFLRHVSGVQWILLFGSASHALVLLGAKWIAIYDDARPTKGMTCI